MPTSELFTSASRPVFCDTVRYAMPAVIEPLTLSLPSASSYSAAWGLLLAGNVFFGLALTAFALSRNFALSCILLALVGAGMVCITTTVNTLLQMLVQDEMRGRVMSMYALAFIGLPPVGGLLMGALADLIGCTVVSESGADIGSIVGVPNFGGGDLLEIKPATGGATAFLPFTRAFVPVVTIAQRRVIASPPDDLFAAPGQPPDDEDEA